MIDPDGGLLATAVTLVVFGVLMLGVAFRGTP